MSFEILAKLPRLAFYIGFAAYCGETVMSVEMLAGICIALGALDNIFFDNSSTVCISGGLAKKLVNGIIGGTIFFCGPQSLFCGIAAAYFGGWFVGLVTGLAFYAGGMALLLLKNCHDFKQFA